MIVTNIIGGLGNQMFQYAAGRALSLMNDQPLRLDVSTFDGYNLHNGFELSRLFMGPMNLATSDELLNMLGWRAVPIIKRQLLKNLFSMLRGNRFIVEPHFQYWSGIHQVQTDAYLSGYWQSSKYFKGFENDIRADFVFKQILTDKNHEMASKILACNAVSIHVRRGDYVQNPNTLSTHGICSLDYYNLAIRHISKCIENPIFFVFSDDMAWVRKNFKIEFPYHHIDHNLGAESYNDMRLMSMCKHHIIANSSFSWWGAWLNPCLDKVVVAPDRWFVNATNTNDLIPNDWVRL